MKKTSRQQATKSPRNKVYHFDEQKNKQKLVTTSPVLIPTKINKNI